MNAACEPLTREDDRARTDKKIAHIYGVWPPIEGAPFIGLCGTPAGEDRARVVWGWPKNHCSVCGVLWDAGQRPIGWDGRW